MLEWRFKIIFCRRKQFEIHLLVVSGTSKKWSHTCHERTFIQITILSLFKIVLRPIAQRLFRYFYEKNWNPDLLLIRNGHPLFLTVIHWEAVARPEVFCKKGVLRNFAKFTGKPLCKSLFLIKLQASACNLLKERLWHRGFPVNFAKVLKIPFLTEHIRWLLLSITRLLLLERGKIKSV